MGARHSRSGSQFNQIASHTRRRPLGYEQVRKVDGRTALAKRKRATRLTLHILAAVAEHEREMIAERTKAALQAAKARGIRLGRNGC